MKFRRNKVKKSANIFLHNRHYEKFADGTVKDIEDEIPFDVPEGWVWCRLGRICDFIGGGTPDKSRNDFWNGTINWASVKDIKGDFLYSTEDKITEIGLKESSAHLASKGDVILVTRISPGKAIITQIETSINQDLKIVIPKINLNKQFLLYFFQGSESDFFENSSGTTVKGIKLEFLISKLIPLPPLEEQERIVKEIEHSFSLINSLEKDKTDLQTAIKQAKSKILDLAIHGKLVPQDANDEPASVLLEKLRVEKEEKIAKGELKRDKNDSYIYKSTTDNCHYQKFVDGSEVDISDELYFNLPSGWCYARYNSFVTFTGGSQPPKETFEYKKTDDNIRLIQIRDYKTDKFITYIPKSKARRFCSKDDIMIGRYGPPLFQILRGIEGAYNVALMKAECDQRLMDREYLYYLLQERRLLLLLESISDRTCGQDGVNVNVLENYIIGIPPLAEQKRIVEKIENAFAKLDQIAEKLA